MSKKPSLGDRYWKFYSFLLRAVGRLFIVAGIIGLYFLAADMMGNKPIFSKSDGLEGIGMILMIIVVGFLVIWVGKMKD
jgi:uncharacterized membrane protein